MSRTIQDLILQARRILQDLQEPYRYPTEELVDILNGAVYELKRLRPDVWMGQFGEDLPFYSVDDMAEQVPFPMLFFQPVVLYISGYAELRDDEFSVDSRAASLLSAFAQQLSAPGAGVVPGSPRSTAP